MLYPLTPFVFFGCQHETHSTLTLLMVYCVRGGGGCLYDCPCDRMTGTVPYSGSAVLYNTGRPLITSRPHCQQPQTLFLTRLGPTMVIGAGCVDPFGSYRNCSSRGENPRLNIQRPLFVLLTLLTDNTVMRCIVYDDTVCGLVSSMDQMTDKDNKEGGNITATVSSRQTPKSCQCF